MKITVIDHPHAAHSLRCAVCPACGLTKSEGMPLCGVCYWKLDAYHRIKCFARWKKYLSAIKLVLTRLGKSEMILPVKLTAGKPAEK